MNTIQKAKKIVRDYYELFDTPDDDRALDVLKQYTTTDYYWRGMHPFYERRGANEVFEIFWRPLRKSFAPIQRREDIFFSGMNDCDKDASLWVLSAGHLLGLFDNNWLGIPSTGKIILLRYAEFHRVVRDKIAETALFCDILSVMNQAGQYPLPPMTGAAFIYPGPRTHNGLLLAPQNSTEGIKTMTLVNQMISELTALNKSDSDHCPPEVLAKTWHEDMLWYGPTGIGASYTIPRYQQQHQYPFRENLADKVFNGHIARFAEGNYCAFFGWPSLNNRNKGGFLGLPASSTHAPMHVVDIYRREGDKLAENWVYIDILHYLYEQGLDVLQRMKRMNRV